MRNNFYPLQIPATVTAGATQTCRDLREKYIQIFGTFSATLSIEVSLNGGADFFAVLTGLTAPGLHPIPYPATHVRVRTTTFGSGVPAAVIAGFDDNG
jgi:hypothetical protein